jgi:putative ABC transport system ATP-binding protein
MLAMKNLSKVYRTGLVETHALRNVDLNIDAGEFVAITGPSGSGKSTFLNIAGLLEGSTTGEYRLDGEDVSNLSDRERSRLRNQKIGFVFQSFNLIPSLSVYKNIELPLRYRGMTSAERKERTLSQLNAVGLTGRALHLPSQLSGGQQQRVGIARALCMEPKILLADEPTGNLDSAMSQEILATLEKLNQNGMTVILVTHDPNCAARAQRQVKVVDGMCVTVDER